MRHGQPSQELVSEGVTCSILGVEVSAVMTGMKHVGFFSLKENVAVVPYWAPTRSSKRK